MDRVRPSTQKTPKSNYRAVLRDDRGRVVWACEHTHRNRDTGFLDRSVDARDTGSYVLAAYDCAMTEWKARGWTWERFHSEGRKPKAEGKR